jgi:DNA uptake protein ComE-like DNA-binding protein
MIRRILLGLILAISAFAFAKPKADELVDVNRASVTGLMSVHGMTNTWAERIVRFRPYRTKLDLKEKGVVTPEVYLRIRDGIVAHRVGK